MRISNSGKTPVRCSGVRAVLIAAAGLGTHLGLSMHYYIVAQEYGGTLAVESELGEGAALVVRLPLQPTTKLPDVSS